MKTPIYQRKASADYKARKKAEGLKPYTRTIKPEFFPKMDAHLEKLKNEST